MALNNDQMSLFEGEKKINTPLAHRVRPETLESFFGQKKALEKIKRLYSIAASPLILYGPPGCGKTTLAKLIASEYELSFFEFNAVLSGVKELRSLIESAKNDSKKAIIFIDEIHRFNKAQQDALLPYVETGDFILIGATTEYPKTSVNKALLSRVHICKLEKHSKKDIQNILIQNANASESLAKIISDHADGDARFALNQLAKLGDYSNLSDEDIKQRLEINRDFDKDSNRHYDVISAFIKSIRGSDVDAAILWLAVMIDGGESPDYIARRLMISASEDIGNADPRALQMANSAHYAVQHIGMPEARIILAQATTYLALAPKSNSSYLAINDALSFVRQNPTLEVPTHLRNHHPDKKNYKYPHSFPKHFVKQQYLPDNCTHNFFKNSYQGYEQLQQNYKDKIQ